MRVRRFVAHTTKERLQPQDALSILVPHTRPGLPHTLLPCDVVCDQFQRLTWDGGLLEITALYASSTLPPGKAKKALPPTQGFLGGGISHFTVVVYIEGLPDDKVRMSSEVQSPSPWNAAQA